MTVMNSLNMDNYAENYNFSLTVDDHSLTGRDFRASPRMEHSLAGFPNKRDNSK